MSNPYAHSLSLLRQTSVILSEQMTSIDLYALRRDTIGGVSDVSSSMLDSTVSAYSSSIPLTQVSQTWTTLLASVAVPLVKFGQEMTRVQADINSQLDSIRNVLRFTWIMETLVILGLLFALTVILNEVNLRFDTGNAIASAGIIIVMMFAIVAGFRIWASALNDQYAEMNRQLKTSLAITLTNYVNALPATQVVVVMYGIVSGSSANSDGQNMVTMPTFIQEKVKISTLLTIADALIDLKELGVDRFDRAPLWANVKSGVDAVRSLCMVAFDDTDPARDITREAIATAIQNEIVPILCIPGVELPRGVYGPTTTTYTPQTANNSSGQITPASINGMTLLNLPSLTNFSGSAFTNSNMSLSECARAIIYSGSEYAFGYYDNSNAQCFACSNVSAFNNSFTSNAANMAATSNQVIVSRPSDLNGSNAATSSSVSGSSSGSSSLHATSSSVSGSSSGSSSASSQYDASTLYLASLSTPWAMAATILDQSGHLQDRLLVVLKRYKYAIDLDANRSLIDRGLEAFYGVGNYKSGGISNAIDTVLSDLKTAAIKFRANGNNSASIYVDTDRMMEKISLLSNDSTTALSNTLQSLQDATASYVNLYAPFLSSFPQKLANIIALFGGGALLVAYGAYVTLVRMQYVNDKINNDSMIQRTIVSTCLLIVSLFATETMLTQSALKSQHNMNAMSDNSMMLIGATVRINDEFADLLASIKNWNGNGKGNPAANVIPSAYNAPRAKAVAFLADCKGVVEKFEACNTITAQQSDLPLPLTEILMYAIVGGGVLVFAAVCLNSIQPSDRIQTIGTINRLISRIADGDSGAIQEAKTIVECARPPVDVEKMLSWLGILVFAWLTVWFAFQSILALNRYKSNLDANGNCA